MTQTDGKRSSPGATLASLLQARADERSDQPLYTFLADGERASAHLTYGELDREARRIAALLQPRGVAGEPVLLVCPPGLKFIAAFFGCLYARAIPTPAYPPTSDRNTLRLSCIAADARPRVALTLASVAAQVRGPAALRAIAECEWLEVDRLDDVALDGWRLPPIDPDDVALLQYTSGSTASPKGVMISHRNLMHNQRLIQRAFGQDEDSVIVSWLPLYHDMGLIGAVLQPIYVGARCVLMAPAAFLQRPVRWLQAISRYRGTRSGAPNFAFDLCVRRVDAADKQQLDLSCWSVAFNGAEPVQAATLDRFANAFAGCGFRREALRPCYGLAEATLLVSAAGTHGPQTRVVDARALERGVVGNADSSGAARRLVSSGAPPDGQSVVIVDPESRQRQARGRIGEIWVAGPSVSCGYWKRGQESEELLRARLADSDPTPYLRTGDLGFLDEGQLFVVGRVKDLIIVNGLNYSPIDLEVSAQQTHPALRPHAGAAFALDNGGEVKVVLLQELERRGLREAQSLIPAIRERILRDHEILPHVIVLVKSNTLPMTTSGKIRRSACRDLFLGERLEVVAEWRRGDDDPGRGPEAPRPAESMPRTAMEELVARHWTDVLASPSVSADENFFEAGGDSVTGIQLIARLGEELQRELPPDMLFRHPSLRRLAVALAQTAQELPGAPSPVRRVQERYFPLSFAQQRLWIREQLQPGLDVYNVPFALRLLGDLDVEALRRTLDAILQRHDILRTSLVKSDGPPLQAIAGDLTLDVPLIELAGAEAEARMRAWIDAATAFPFDLERPPLVRAGLLRLASREHVLSLTLHHLVCDEWSAGVMLREFAAIYPAQAHGRRAALPDLGVQYADLSAWQREHFSAHLLDAQLEYWRGQIAGASQSLTLPVDQARPPTHRRRAGHCTLHVDRARTDRLKRLAREADATLFMMMTALFELLLRRYSGQDHFLLGTPIANRALAASHELIGCLANTLVLPCDLRGDPSVRVLLQRVREAVLGAHRNQDLPFQMLVEKMQPERNLSRSPLFQAMVLVRHPWPEVRIEGLRVEPLSVDNGAAMYELTLEVKETGEGLQVALHYDADLFEAETAQQLTRHLDHLVDAALDAPDVAGSTLPLLDTAERKHILWGWNDTRRDYGEPLRLDEWFDAQARRTPHAVAVCCETQHLTYGALRQRADQVAAWLRARGVGPEDRVGVCLQRSVEMITVLLGVLKAGAMYMPLDPNYPRERLAFMVADAQLGAVVAREALAKDWPDDLAVLCLDHQQELPVRVPTPLPLESVGAANGAYLIYTSGSTGRPKGVVNTHRGIFNRLRWMQDVYALGPTDRFVQKTSFTFDVSVWEIFAPLVSGACLVMARPDGQRDPTYLTDLVCDEQITLVHFVPAQLPSFLDHADASACRSLRQVICSGEALPPEVTERYYRTLDVRLDNLYGPTEAAVEATAWQCLPGPQPSVPIGRPIANVRTYVLDPHGEPVPPGVAGELFLGGVGVARGYWRRPALTAERFCPDSFGAPGERLYRTGDAARWLRGGEIEFLGRLDDQVKIRGHRIELGEIESVLREHEAVGGAVVLARPTSGSERRLVAYVVSVGGAPLGWRELRAYVRRRLPEHMVPAAIEVLPAFPLNASGKVDRKALPETQRVTDADMLDEQAWETPTQELLASIWAEVLGLERIGIQDNFFEVGGHSLLATQVVARIHAVYGVSIPLRQLFERPTVAALAELIDTLPRAHEVAPAPREPGAPAPVSFAQQRLWFLDQLEPGGSAYIMAAALRITGRLNPDALRRALIEVARRHEVLRTRYPALDGAPVPQIDPPGALAWRSVDLRETHEAEREPAAWAIVGDERTRPFDLQQGPLFRSTLVQLTDDAYLATIALHHIACDGWSIGVLLRELKALYRAALEGAASPLPEPPLQYGDYAAWQRELLSGALGQRQLEYWTGQLSGLAPLDLPNERSATAALGDAADCETLLLDEGLSERLRLVGRREGVTLFMLFLAALQLVLSRYSGSGDVAVGTPIAGRTRRVWEPLIGFFVNTLVMRTRLTDDLTGRELLARVRETALRAYAHQDVPFERVVEALRPGRDSADARLLQVFLNVVNVPHEPLELEGAWLTWLPDEPTHAKFDLTLYVYPDPGRLRLSLVHRSALIARDTARTLLEHVQMALTSLAERPDMRLGDISFATRPPTGTQIEAAVRHQPQLHETLHGLFLAQARRTPEAIAILCGARTRTYAQLEHYVERLAAHLARQGVRPGDVVAVAAQRAEALAGALLAVLTVGAGFAIVDPDCPPSRLEGMLRAVRPQAWLEIEGETARGLAATTTLLDELGLVARQRLAPELTLDALADSGPVSASAHAPMNASCLAYVAFTSGTSGFPLAIAGSHAPVIHFVRWCAERLGVTAMDRVSLLSGLAHDPLLRDVFMPLLTGASVCVPTAEDMAGPALATWMRATGVSVAHMTPGLARHLCATAPTGTTLPALRWVVFGGEPMIRADGAAVFRLAPGVRLLDGYGTTETPQLVSALEVTRADTQDLERHLQLAAGTDASRLLVLRPDFCLAGVNEWGEIFVRSPYLSMGYWRDAALTAERFLPDPFTDPGEDGGARLYRTGDLGRRRADGSVQFLGRRDGQVKVDGHRVELAEIATALREHPAVRDAVMTVVADMRSGARLVGHVVTSRPLPVHEWRAHLRRRLHEYMLPVRLVCWPQLPLTANKKIDRGALEAAVAAPPHPDLTPPRNEIEEVLAGIWLDVLGRERVGVQDDFFELGGHSLLATRIVARVRAALHVALPVRVLFEHPTIAALARTVGEARRGTPLGAVSSPRREPRDGRLPLSSAQQRLWFIEQLAPARSAYQVSAAARLSGPLDVDALRAALRGVVRRHDALRTRFGSLDGRPFAQVDSDIDVELRCVERDGGVGRANLEWLAAEAVQELQRAERLEAAPRLRATLLRLGPEEHVLALSLHHLVTDGWSMGLLRGELTALYLAARSGAAPALVELPLHYADYVAWQQESLGDGDARPTLEYWATQLAGLEALQLPTDKPRPRVQTYKGAAEACWLPAPLVERLRAVGRSEQATLFMVLLAAYQGLLAWASGQRDVAVGTPVAGRTRVEFEDLIGFFVNTLVLRTRLVGDPSFRDVLRQVRETALEAYVHQDVPFARLIEYLHPERDASRNPLFQTLLVFQRAAPDSDPPPEMTLTPIALPTTSAKFDLTLTVLDDGASLRAVMEYNTDLFRPERITELLRHLHSRLERVATDPDLRLSELQALDPAEQACVLYRCSGPTLAPASSEDMATLFACQAARTPERVALIDGERHVTYGELDSRVGALARRLVRHGVGPDVAVAVCLPRSVELVVAVLAVLEAGGAYVPIDPKLPPGRIAFLLADSGARVVVAARERAEWTQALSGKALLLEPDARDEQRGAVAMPRKLGGEAALAVIYTSGSTGRPKGVVATHGAVLNRFRWMWGEFPFGADEVCCLKTSPGFVDAVWETLGPLLAGVRGVVVSDTALGDPEALVALLARESVTRIVLVPSLLDALLVTVEDLGARLPALRLWASSGEALPPHLAAAFESAAPDATLLNLYGTSEVSADVTCHVVRGGHGVGRVPIGRPIANTQVYVLDEFGNLCDVEVPGEICVAGANLARGYLGRPAETAACFTPDPFATRPGARLYRTGDLGRYRHDGGLEHLGRRDAQVKIRGYRIETAEVEQVLLRHPEVQQAQVLAVGETHVAARLVAFVALANSARDASARLRAHCAANLPGYMVPASFVALGAFPLLPNGKVDRRALARLEVSAPIGRNTRPPTALERALTEIWRDVLGAPVIEPSDNFFDVGGNSLALPRLKALIQARLDRHVALTDLFAYPTIAALARYLAPDTAERDVVAEVRAHSARRRRTARQRPRREV
jgi:amino acid adenylation domain-containing protein